MGSGNRNHHRNLQVAVAVAVDQNFLIFGGRFGHQRRGPTLLLSENCDSNEKDWTDRSLRVWVDHQQQPQPRSGCTSRLRLKSLSWMGPLSMAKTRDTHVVVGAGWATASQWRVTLPPSATTNWWFCGWTARGATGPVESGGGYECNEKKNYYLNDKYILHWINIKLR